MREYSSTVEQLPFKQLVRGSNPRAPTKNNMIRITKKEFDLSNGKHFRRFYNDWQYFKTK